MIEPLSESQVIENLRQTEDPSAQYYAAWWLGKMRSRHPDAIPLLLTTLKALNDTPVDPDRRGVALNAIRALGLLQDDRADAAVGVRPFNGLAETVIEYGAQRISGFRVVVDDLQHASVLFDEHTVFRHGRSFGLLAYPHWYGTRPIEPLPGCKGKRAIIAQMIDAKAHAPGLPGTRVSSALGCLTECAVWPRPGG